MAHRVIICATLNIKDSIMQTIELSVGKQGRIVIPAYLRKQLAIKAGSQLLAWVEDGRLVMETKAQLWDLVHKACSKIPKDIDMTQELINERRKAAIIENK